MSSSNREHEYVKRFDYITTLKYIADKLSDLEERIVFLERVLRKIEKLDLRVKKLENAKSGGDASGTRTLGVDVTRVVKNG